MSNPKWHDGRPVLILILVAIGSPFVVSGVRGWLVGGFLALVALAVWRQA